MKSHLLALFAIWLVSPCLGPSAFAAVPGEAAMPDATSLPASNSQTVDKQQSPKEGPTSLFEDEQPDANNGSIVVRIHTSRDKDAKDNCTVYPYPVKPPTCDPPAPLPDRGAGLNNLIRNTSFLARPNLDKPFPTAGGWRWIFAYKAALAKSGLSEPHTIFGEYSFASDLTPYVAAECKRRNVFEKQRRKIYEQAIDDYNRTHEELEVQAVKTGLKPVALRLAEYGLAKGQMPPGTWWLQVTRKLPGLKFYWLQPVTSVAGKRTEVNLNDNNALAIIGAW